MKLQGYLMQRPAPRFINATGELVAGIVDRVIGWEISPFEGFMIVVSTIVCLISLAVWIIIDVGNRQDQEDEKSALGEQQRQRELAATRHEGRIQASAASKRASVDGKRL